MSISSGNGLVPNKQQAITWTNADPGHWCIYAALGGDELNKNMATHLMIRYLFTGAWSSNKLQWLYSKIGHQGSSPSNGHQGGMPYLLGLQLTDRNTRDFVESVCHYMCNILTFSDSLVNSLKPGGRFKNTYELLNLRALKISKLHKNHIFQCMGKIFCVEFQRVPLKFHTKYLTHTLKDVDFIHIWKFKSSLI